VGGYELAAPLAVTLAGFLRVEDIMAGLRDHLHRGLVGALGLAALSVAAVPTATLAQATSRICQGDGGETPGPACLVAHVDVGKLPSVPIYWSVYNFPNAEAAQRAKPPQGAVVEAFGKTWLFTVGPMAPALAGGARLKTVGPIPLTAGGGAYIAEFLKSTFSPGMSAPLHIHSGPEAFYALDGASCLETPDGPQVARGEGHTLIVRAGPPMLLMAIGDQTRHGFALILHDGTQPPTTLVHDWAPKGLCPTG
jgi:quercetin dioxygenase-like cupin family protein